MVHSAGVMGVQPQPVTCTQQGVAESAQCATWLEWSMAGHPGQSCLHGSTTAASLILRGAEEASAHGLAGLTPLLRGSSCPHIPTE